jgi:WD40 repeat protein
MLTCGRLVFVALAIPLALIVCVPAAGGPQRVATTQKARIDPDGNPLPDGALLRIGTTRIRPSGTPQVMAFTPDGSRLCTIDNNTGVHLWDVAAGKEVFTFPRVGAREPFYAVSNDGSLAAFIDGADTCRIYETSTGREVNALKISSGKGQALAFSADKRLLACAGQGMGVRLWEIASGAVLRSWENISFQDWRSLRLAFSPDAMAVALGSRAASIFLFDVNTGQQSEIGNTEGADGEIVYSPTGKFLAAVPKDGRNLTLLNLATKKAMPDSPRDQGSYWCATFTPDGKQVVTGNYPGKVCFWDLATGKLEHKFTGHPGEVESLAFSPDGKLLATGSGGCTVRIWDVASGKQQQVFAGAHAALLQARFTTNGKAIASICNPWYCAKTADGATVRLWDPATGLAQRQVDRDPEKTAAICLSGDGRVVACASNDGEIRLHQMVSGEDGPKWNGPEGRVLAVRMTSDASYLVTVLQHIGKPPEFAGTSHSFHIWDAATGKLAFSVTGKEGEDFTCRFTNDDRYLAVHPRVYSQAISEGQPVYTVGQPIFSFALWDFRAGRKVLRAGPPFAVTQLGIFSPSGRVVASLDDMGEGIVLREVATGQGMPVAGVSAKLTCLAFTPDGRTLAAGTRDGYIILWDFASQTTVAKMSGHYGPILALDFSPDGRRLVSGGDDTTMFVWDVARWTDPSSIKAKPLGPGNAVRLWDDLATDNASRAYASITSLLRSPKDAVRLVGQKLQPTQPSQTQEIARWIANLDSKRYAEREQAMARLQRLGNAVVPALDHVLASTPTLEVRRRAELLLAGMENQPLPREWLQAQRGLEVLELLGTADAMEVLDSLSRGAPEGWLTQEARASLDRVRKRGRQ